MAPKKNPHSDTKLLLAVAGVVVAGAVGVALVAGLTVQRDPSASRAVKDRQASPAIGRTIAESEREQPTVQAALLDSTRLDVPPAPAIELVPVAFEIAPDVDPWREGSRAYHQRDYARAAAYFRADAEARPDRAYTHYMLGLALWKSGELDGAFDAMERSATVNDQSIRTFINLSRIQNARGEYEGAQSAAERALGIDAENPTALYQLARSQYNLGRVDEATATLESAIDLDQAAAEAHNLLGLVRLRTGDETDALRSFEVAAALKPEVAYIQNNLGLAFEQSGRFDDAAIALRRAIEIDGNHQAAAVSLARIESRLPLETSEEVAAVELAEARSSDPPVTEVVGPPADSAAAAARTGGGSSD
jgi:tetratricopeptide (TPR) repeat protein